MVFHGGSTEGTRKEIRLGRHKIEMIVCSSEILGRLWSRGLQRNWKAGMPDCCAAQSAISIGSAQEDYTLKGWRPN